MRISKLIKELEMALQDNGDVEVYLPTHEDGFVTETIKLEKVEKGYMYGVNGDGLLLVE